MHLAVKLSQPEVVESLLELGADVTKTDKKGFTPLSYAVECQEDNYETIKCFELLLPRLKSSSDLSQLLISAAESGFFFAVVSLLKAGADVNSIEIKSGKNILHLVIEGQYKELVNYLLKEVCKSNLIFYGKLKILGFILHF